VNVVKVVGMLGFNFIYMKEILLLSVMLFSNISHASLPDAITSESEGLISVDGMLASNISSSDSSDSSDLHVDYYNEAHNDDFYYDGSNNNAAPE
jgi:hypothetical protein